jgi:two-component system, OmpR family, sensor kinase
MTTRAGMSLALRLAVVSGVVSALLLGGFSLVIVGRVGDAAAATATHLADADLLSYEVDLLAQPQQGPDEPADGLLVLVEAPGGEIRRSSMPDDLAAAARGVRGDAEVAIAGGRFRVVARTVVADDGEWRLWAARDLTTGEALLRGVRMTVLIGVPLAVLVIVLATWLVVAGALRPVERMRATAEHLRAPRSTGLLPDRGGRELGRLAGTLNSLITDLRAGSARERRVTADAAHELRTPLAVLSAQVELAQRDPHPGALDEIRTSVDRMTRLTDDLLALFRAESGEIPAVGTEVGALVTEAMAAVDRARLIAPPTVLVDLELMDPLDEHATVATDELSFGRMLTNLLANAIAAGPASAVVVRIEQSDGDLVIGVADDGPGVPVEFLPRAFDRFSRPDSSRSSGSPGAGLGLALVRRLAEQAGGSATLHNTPSGALAAVRVPIREA